MTDSAPRKLAIDDVGFAAVARQFLLAQGHALKSHARESFGQDYGRMIDTLKHANP
jgi:hypothetical protein